MRRSAFYHLLTIVMLLFIPIGSAAAQTATPSDDCPASQFEGWGAIGVVTPGDANNLRAEPSTGSALIGKVQPGEPFAVFQDNNVCAGGYLWQEIQTLTQRGWMVEIPVDGDEPFIVPYESPEPREVGIYFEDGTIRVEENGVAFTIPAGFDIVRVTVVPHVGFFGESMSAQPSSIIFEFHTEEAAAGELQIFPYAILDGASEYLEYGNLETLLDEQPSLLEYAAANEMPQTPIGGAAALFGGAGAYVPFASGSGLRYLTYFAQTWIIFSDDTWFRYMYRGLSENDEFFIAAEWFGVRVPEGTVPPEVAPTDEAYGPYLRRFEANLAEQPDSAFSPDLGLVDSLFASLTITDSDRLLDAIP